MNWRMAGEFAHRVRFWEKRGNTKQKNARRHARSIGKKKKKENQRGLRAETGRSEASTFRVLKKKRGGYKWRREQKRERENKPMLNNCHDSEAA